MLRYQGWAALQGGGVVEFNGEFFALDGETTLQSKLLSPAVI